MMYVQNIKSDNPNENICVRSYVLIISRKASLVCFIVDFSTGLFESVVMSLTLTGRRTTQHTDKCTDKITRLCTSVVLDGLNLTEKQVVCIVSICISYVFVSLFFFS